MQAMGPTPVPKTKLWVSVHLLCASTPGAIKGASHAGVVTFTENNIPPTKLTARCRKDGINTEDLRHVGHGDPLGKRHKNQEVTLCPASHLSLDRYIDLLAQQAPHLSTCHLSPPAALTGSTLNPPTTGCGPAAAALRAGLRLAGALAGIRESSMKSGCV